MTRKAFGDSVGAYLQSLDPNLKDKDKDIIKKAVENFYLYKIAIGEEMAVVEDEKKDELLMQFKGYIKYYIVSYLNTVGEDTKEIEKITQNIDELTSNDFNKFTKLTDFETYIDPKGYGSKIDEKKGKVMMHRLSDTLLNKGFKAKDHFDKIKQALAARNESLMEEIVTFRGHRKNWRSILYTPTTTTTTTTTELKRVKTSSDELAAGMKPAGNVKEVNFRQKNGAEVQDPARLISNDNKGSSVQL